MQQILRSIHKQNRNLSTAVSVRRRSVRSIGNRGPVEPFQKGSVDLLVSWENSADTSSSSGPTWSSGSDMILAIILRDRSGSSCLNGRRRTRDWSGRRIVDVRWTRIEEVVIMDWLIRRNEPGSRNYFQRELSFQSCLGWRYDSFDRLEESNGGHKYRVARPCGCRN